MEKGSTGCIGGKKEEKRNFWEGLLILSSKEAELGLVQVVLQLEESHPTIVWTKPGFLLPRKYKMEMEVNVNNSK